MRPRHLCGVRGALATLAEPTQGGMPHLLLGAAEVRAIEAAANARVQEEIARWSEAERTALGYKEQLVQAEGRLVTLESELATATAGLAEKVRTAANFASPDFCLSRGSACGVCVVCTVPFWAGLEHRSRAQHCALLSPFVFGVMHRCFSGDSKLDCVWR